MPDTIRRIGPWARRATVVRGPLAGGYEMKCYLASPMERASIVKNGVPASYVMKLVDRMAIPKDKFYGTVGLARATIDRKVREQRILNQDESERVVAFARLVGQVQTLVQESGESSEFDAPKWLAAWLDRPLPALAGQRPSVLMDTMDGRSLVSDLLAQQQSSAYA